MKAIILSAAIALLSCFSAFGQNGSIEGNIMDIDSITALSGVSVYLDNTNLGTATNGNGYYTINDIPAGTYTLVVSAIGYVPLEQDVTVGVGEGLKVDFTMTESVTTLAEVTVMTRGNSGLKDIPGSVHYLSPKEIQKFSYTNINRTLRTVPGINIQEEDGFGLRPNIGLRGTGVERSSKITLMEDGVLMAPAPYAAPSAYYFPTIGRMQGVEVLKGSSQIKYGPYTTGGAINLISTQIPNTFSGRINVLGGSFGGRTLHAFVGNTHQNFGYMVESFQYSSGGFKKLDGGGNTGFDKQDYLAKLKFNTKPDALIPQSLTFKIGQTLETSNETYLGLTPRDFDIAPYRRYSGSQKDQMNAEQSQVSLTHVAELFNTLDITTTAYRSDFRRNWYKLDKVKDNAGAMTSIARVLEDPANFAYAYSVLGGASSAAPDALFVKANNRSYYAQGIQTVLSFNFNTNAIQHKMDLGFRAHQDQIDRFQWVDEYAMDDGIMKLTKAGIPGTESNRIETANAAAAYIQYKVGIDHFTATPGIRYENITLAREEYGKADPDRIGIERSERSNTVDVFIPGIGLDYQFSKYLRVFAGVHKGFSPPGSRAGTVPEESVNYEWGVRYAKRTLAGQAVVFYNDYSNLLGSDLAASGGAGTGALFNAGEVESKGLEFQVRYDLLSSRVQSEYQLPLSLSYTYTDAVFQSDFKSAFEGWGEVVAGDRLPYIANHQLAIALGIEHPLFSINISGRYMDAMRTAPGQGDIAVNEKIDSYFVIDGSAHYNLHQNIALFANVTNLTDQVYVVARRPAGLRPGMPRAFNAGVKATF